MASNLSDLNGEPLGTDPHRTDPHRTDPHRRSVASNLSDLNGEAYPYEETAQEVSETLTLTLTLSLSLCEELDQGEDGLMAYQGILLPTRFLILDMARYIMTPYLIRI